MLSFLCLSMISANAFGIRREGKPVSTFPDHALGCVKGRRLGGKKTVGTAIKYAPRSALYSPPAFLETCASQDLAIL
jgi:hypothetical protein